MDATEGRQDDRDGRIEDEAVVQEAKGVEGTSMRQASGMILNEK